MGLRIPVRRAETRCAGRRSRRISQLFESRKMNQRDAKTGKEHREFFNIDMSSGWETIAPGIEAKILAGAIDEAGHKGHLNRIVRWAPHAEIATVNEHNFYEEVFVAKGALLVASQKTPIVSTPSLPRPSLAGHPTPSTALSKQGEGVPALRDAILLLKGMG